MFNTIINLKPYKHKVKEDFIGSIFGGLVKGGDSTSIKDKTTVNKNFDNNQRINRSMAVEAVTKLVNNVATDVIQKNSAEASSAAAASNTIWLQNVNCSNVVITGVSQDATAISQVQVKTQQQNMSKIANEISTTIDKTIEKIGATDLAALQADNTKMLDNFMKAMPGYDPNKAQEMASKCPKAGESMISVGNKCDVSNEYELNASVKNVLDLDESFKIKDTDDISNDIKNKVEQSNFASCQASATANNAIILNDITCDVAEAVATAKKIDKAKAAGKPPGKLEISDIQQKAVAQLYMTCIFDQKNVSEIANKIVNKISKKYSQVYDAVQKKAEKLGPEYAKNAGDFLDVWSAAGIEKIAAAAGMLPPAPATKAPATTAPATTAPAVKDEIKKSGADIVPMPIITLAPDTPRPTQRPRAVQSAETAVVATPAPTKAVVTTAAPTKDFLEENKLAITAVGVVATVGIIYLLAK